MGDLPLPDGDDTVTDATRAQDELPNGDKDLTSDVSEDDDLHKRSAKARTVVLNWLETHPQKRMLVLVLALKPAVHLGNRLLHVSGPDFHVLEWQQLLLGTLPPGQQYRTVRSTIPVPPEDLKFT